MEVAKILLGVWAAIAACLWIGFIGSCFPAPQPKSEPVAVPPRAPRFKRWLTSIRAAKPPPGIGQRKGEGKPPSKKSE